MSLGNIVLFREQIKQSLENSQVTGIQPVFCVKEEEFREFEIAYNSMTDEFIKYKTMPIVVLDKITVQRGNIVLFSMVTLLAETMAKLTRTEPMKVLQKFNKTAKELIDSMSEEEMLDYLKKYGVISQETSIEDIHAQVKAENN